MESVKKGSVGGEKKQGGYWGRDLGAKGTFGKLLKKKKKPSTSGAEVKHLKSKGAKNPSGGKAVSDLRCGSVETRSWAKDHLREGSKSTAMSRSERGKKDGGQTPERGPPRVPDRELNLTGGKSRKAAAQMKGQ